MCLCILCTIFCVSSVACVSLGICPLHLSYVIYIIVVIIQLLQYLYIPLYVYDVSLISFLSFWMLETVVFLFLGQSSYYFASFDGIFQRNNTCFH